MCVIPIKCIKKFWRLFGAKIMLQKTRWKCTCCRHFCVTLSFPKILGLFPENLDPLTIHKKILFKIMVCSAELRQCSPSWHQKWWNLFLSKIKLLCQTHEYTSCYFSSLPIQVFQLWSMFYGEGFTNKFKPWLSSNVTWKLGNEFSSIEEEVSFVMPQIWYTELPRVEKFLFFFEVP